MSKNSAATKTNNGNGSFGNGNNSTKVALSAQWAALKTGSFLDDDVLDISSESEIGSSESEEAGSTSSADENSTYREQAFVGSRNMPPPSEPKVAGIGRRSPLPVHVQEKTKSLSTWSAKSSFKAFGDGNGSAKTEKPRVQSLKITIKRDSLSNGDARGSNSVGSTLLDQRSAGSASTTPTAGSTGSPKLAFFPRKTVGRQPAEKVEPSFRHFPKNIVKTASPSNNLSGHAVDTVLGAGRLPVSGDWSHYESGSKIVDRVTSSVVGRHPEQHVVNDYQVDGFPHTPNAGENLSASFTDSSMQSIRSPLYDPPDSLAVSRSPTSPQPMTPLEQKFGKHAMINLFRTFRHELKGDYDAHIFDYELNTLVERSSTPPVSRQEIKDFETASAPVGSSLADMHVFSLREKPLLFDASEIKDDVDRVDDKVKIDLLLPYQQVNESFKTPLQPLVLEFVNATRRSQPLETSALNDLKQIKCRMMNLSRFPKPNKHLLKELPLPRRVDRVPILQRPEDEPSSSRPLVLAALEGVGCEPRYITGGGTTPDVYASIFEKSVPASSEASSKKETPSSMIKPKNKGGRPKGWNKSSDGPSKRKRSSSAAVSAGGNEAKTSKKKKSSGFIRRQDANLENSETNSMQLSTEFKAALISDDDGPGDASLPDQQLLLTKGPGGPGSGKKGTKKKKSLSKVSSRRGESAASKASVATPKKKKTIKISSKGRPALSSGIVHEPFGNVLPSPANFVPSFMPAPHAVPDGGKDKNRFISTSTRSHQEKRQLTPASAVDHSAEDINRPAISEKKKAKKSPKIRAEEDALHSVLGNKSEFTESKLVPPLRLDVARLVQTSPYMSPQRIISAAGNGASAQLVTSRSKKKIINISSFINKHTRESRRSQFWSDILKRADGSRYKAEFERRRLREMALKKVNCRIERIQQDAKVVRRHHAGTEPQSSGTETALNEALMLAHKDYIRVVTKDVPKRAKEFIDLRRKRLVNARRVVDGCKKQWEFKRFGGVDGEQPSNAAMLSVGGPTFQELKWRSIIARKKAGTLFRKRVKTLRNSRKQRDKEEADRVRREMETKESLRQQRKLNFLLTQTELYAHFVSRKCAAATIENGIKVSTEISSAFLSATVNADVRKVAQTENDILRKLDEGGSSPTAFADDQFNTDSIDFGGDAKQMALRNVRQAFERTRQRALDHDRATLAAAAASASAPSATTAASLNALQLKQHFYDDESDDTAERARKASLVEIEQPSLLVGELKHYQLKGIGWLLSLYENGINGILADEMGLGKTIQTIAFLGLLAEKFGIWGPFLVVAPASTLHNWYQELQKFLPKFKTLPYWGSANERRTMRKFWQKKDIHTAHAAFHVVITSYQLAVLDASVIKRVNWQFLVLDEAQAIKSSASMRWNALLSFPCRNRLLLTGTPVQNTMAELWALLHFIMPTLFDSHAEFDEWFSRDIEGSVENKRAMEEKNLNRLHMILKPFMLRRTKKEVEHELGEKIEKLVPCPLSMRQQRLYKALKNRISLQELMLQAAAAARGGVGVRSSNFTDDDAPSGSLMNLVMQFRKVCNHPDLFERRDVISPVFAPLLELRLPRLVYSELIATSALSSGYGQTIPGDLDMWLNCSGPTSQIQNSSIRGVGMLPYMRLMGLTPGDLSRFIYNRSHATVTVPTVGLNVRGGFFTFWSLHVAQLERLKLETLSANFHQEPKTVRTTKKNLMPILPRTLSSWYSMPLIVSEKVNPFSFANLFPFDAAQRSGAADGGRCGQSMFQQLIFTGGVAACRGAGIVIGPVDLVIYNLNKEPIEHRKMREERQWLMDKLMGRIRSCANAAVVVGKTRMFANGLIEVIDDEEDGNSAGSDSVLSKPNLYTTPADIERETFGYTGRCKRRHGQAASRGLGRYALKANTGDDTVPGESNLKALQSSVSLLGDSAACSVIPDENDVDDVKIISRDVTLTAHGGELRSTAEIIKCLLLPLPRWVAFCAPAVEAPVVRIYCNDIEHFVEDRRRITIARHLFCHGPQALEQTENVFVDVESRPIVGLLAELPQNLDGVTFTDAFSNIRLPERHHIVTDSGKLRMLDRLLKQLKVEGHRVLLYSQMTRMIDLLEEFFKQKRYRYLRLDGSSSIASRRDMVAKYQSEEDVFIFLLSTRAGGLGINLTAADTVIFYDSDWNPTVDQQAMDRAHRLGQTKQVTVYRLICKGTIEERILMRAQQKSEIQQMVIEGGDFRLDSALKPTEVVSLLLDESGGGVEGEKPMLLSTAASAEKVHGSDDSLTASRDPRGRFTLAASLRR